MAQGPPSSKATTVGALGDPSPGRSGPQLLVVAAGEASTHPLPLAGEVVIGRGADCAVPIDDPSISRRHAVLRMGPPMTIEDLGSANGTRVREQRLVAGQPLPIAPGEVADLGSVVITVQSGSARSAPRRVWPHAYFDVRVEDECARASRDGEEFALLRVHADRSADALIPGVLGDLLRPEDVLGQYGPGEYEVLLVEATPVDAAEFADRAAAALRDSVPKVVLAVASYPRDGTTADELAAFTSACVRADRTGDEAREVIVQDPSMLELYRLLERVAAGTISVLLLGETGVGKEIIASSLHRLSPRKDAPLLRLNCAALPEHLLESELFGHEKGSFTGATAAKQGLLESAQGGTVFLDEIGELPMPVQIKLLRVLEDRQVMRVGALRPHPVDLRFVAATNRDLEAEVSRGSFRQDLYYRIAGVTLRIPPLRSRLAELAPLAQSFVALASRALDRGAPALSPGALSLLRGYDWPGNIRELRNVIERAVLLCEGDLILPEHLPVEKMSGARYSAPAAPRSEPGAPALATPTDPSGARQPSPETSAERQRILDALQSTAGNQKEAAALLGISRRTLLNWLDAHGIARPRKGR